MKKKITKANSNVSFPKLEEEIIEFWKSQNIFQKSLEKTKSGEVFSFIDGPPFVSGTPHYGHFITSIAKDLIPRYQTMKGKYVRRVWGWDCHGLPIENKVNDKFGVTTRSQVESEVGVKEYVSACRQYVNSTISDWEWYIDRIGRFVDIKNAYRTMNNDFMESVWWAFKQLWEKGYIYNSERTSLYSTDTSTPVSHFEVAMDPDNYRDVTDTALFFCLQLEAESIAKLLSDTSLKLEENASISLIAWTTTPWSTPANVALCLNPEGVYSLVKYEGIYFICLSTRVEYSFEGMNGYEVVANFEASKLSGLRYRPLFEDFKLDNLNDYKVYLYDGVGLEEGSGILHVAPAYGEEDFNIGKTHSLSMPHSIDEQGNLISTSAKGMYLRDASNTIINDLQEMGNILRTHQYVHRLPFYRGKNPLIYMSQKAYFVDIQKLKSRMLELNENINWIPTHLKHGRFEETVTTSPDWCISRKRFWATTMPIWESKNSDQLIIGSREELMQYNSEIQKEMIDGNPVYTFRGQELDLHRDIIDDVILTKDSIEYFRIPEVLDCWMDSGSVPFAEHGYPFSGKIDFEKAYPADYIIEYTPQIRAWFSMLMRISVALFDSEPFTNVVCHGTLLGRDGRKMSKTFNNYPDPKDALDSIGAEAMRLYLVSSAIMTGGDAAWSDIELSSQVKVILIPFYNCFSYFTIYADLHEFNPSNTEFNAIIEIDLWLESTVNKAIQDYSNALEEYNFPKSVEIIRASVDSLSTWWIRRNRDRIVNGDMVALQNLYAALTKLAVAFAPQMPFLTEYMYQNLVVGVVEESKESIHLEDFPIPGRIDESLMVEMEKVREICSLAARLRKNASLKLRQPLDTLYVQGLSVDGQGLVNIISSETNVDSVLFNSPEKLDNIATESEGELIVSVNTTLTPGLKKRGDTAEIIRGLQNIRKTQSLTIGQVVDLKIACEDEYIKSLIIECIPQLKSQTFAGDVTFEELEDGHLVKIGEIEFKAVYSN